MARILFVATLACLVPVVCLGADSSSDEELIRVVPSYEEAAYMPNAGKGDEGSPYSSPRPRDQMYVFWLLGKLISYPVDSVESYVTGLFKAPDPRPAVAPVSPDPFAEVEKREIPPAPPARTEPVTAGR